MNDNSKYLGVREGAEIMGVYIDTFRKWIKEGRIKGIRVGRLYKVDREYFNDYLDMNGVIPLVKNK